MFYTRTIDTEIRGIGYVLVSNTFSFESVDSLFESLAQVSDTNRNRMERTSETRTHESTCQPFFYPVSYVVGNQNGLSSVILILEFTRKTNLGNFFLTMTVDVLSRSVPIVRNVSI